MAENSLTLARERFTRREWKSACEAFEAAELKCALDVEDIERLAWAASLAGNTPLMLTGLERAHDMHLSEGRPLRAARAAFWIGFRLIPLGELSKSRAWLQRAQHLVEPAEQEQHDCVERGYLMLPVATRQLFSGQCREAEETARQAYAIAERFADVDLRAFARMLTGRALLRQGQVQHGLSLLDEVMLIVSSAGLSSTVMGLIYCHAIGACAQVYAVDRAREWTASLSTWCDAQPQLVTFAGTCLVHRAELMELGGDWSDAIEEALHAQRVLSTTTDPSAAADASYQQAEIHRLRGDLQAAEAAYANASRSGREPLPGLALLRLSQGGGDAAAAMLRRILSTTTELLLRVRYLPASVEVLLAIDDIDGARSCSDELAKAAETFGSDALQGMAAHARGQVLFAEGNAQDAMNPLRSALLIWQRLGAPYIVARLHVALGQACCALGDPEGAELEWNAARQTFSELGAAPSLAALDAQQARSRAAKTDTPRAMALHGLSARELQVLRLVATGKTNRVIARELCLSEKTVDRHVSNIFAKTNVGSRAAATAYAYEHKLIE